MDNKNYETEKERNILTGCRIVAARIIIEETRRAMRGFFPKLEIDTLCKWTGLERDEIETLMYVARERFLSRYMYNEEMREILLELDLLEILYEENYVVIIDRIANVTSKGSDIEEAYKNLAEDLKLYYK